MSQELLRFGNWRFRVDREKTQRYSILEEQGHCLCGYCRNFYAAVDREYPDLRPFLERFGLSVEAPDELIPYEPTLFDGAYAVSGCMETEDEFPICVNGLQITGQNGLDATVETGMEAPYFVLLIKGIRLPWVLDEPMEDVVSPANEPGFIRKIINRFLRT